MNNIKRVKLFINDNLKSQEVANTLREALEKRGFLIVNDDFQLGIAIGGDGTFLRMVKECNFDSDVYFTGINSGTLGFAQEFSILEIDDFLDGLCNNNHSFEEIGVGEVTVTTESDISKFYSLNEIVVRDYKLNTIGLDIFVDKNLLECYTGDGILVATSFGSTAYNLSFGGSIVFNTFHTLQITPIAPLNNRSYRELNNSVIIPSSKVITLVPTKNSGSLIVTVDGDNNAYEKVLKIEMVIDKKAVKIIRKADYNFIKKINDKFIG